MKLAVFASGTGTNFAAILDYFKGSETVTIACLICDQDKAGALDIARQNNVETFVVTCTEYKTKLSVEKEKEIADYLIEKEIDLIVLAGYMRVIKAPVLVPFKGRIINIHPSLLPSFRGLHAVKQALDFGVKITGCTVHRVDEVIDSGAILGQRSVQVDVGDSESSLHQKIHQEEYKLYPAVIEVIAKGKMDTVQEPVT